jgi:DNA-binding NtrC family response regulator
MRVKLFESLAEISSNTPLNTLSCAPEVIFVRFILGSEVEELIRSCQTRWNDAAIIVIICGADDSSAKVVPSLLEDADDFLFCSAIERELLLRTERILLCRKHQVFCPIAPSNTSANLPLVGQSPKFLAVIKKAVNLARTDATVLISGETGSGKELVARAIHYQGARRSKPFIPVNCGALPDHLFENELFGHQKGAFTDASSTERGLIAESEGGTLFLDEIDALSPSAQVKLLRFLQNGEYRPLGSSRSATADVRIIAASNCDLNDKIERKHFRRDLFYRLNVLSITLPPLRERDGDVLYLAEHFLDVYGNQKGAQRQRLSEVARQKLSNYSWPGNVRELQTVIQRAVLLSRSGMLHAADIELPEGKSKEILRNESLGRAKSFIIGEFEKSYISRLLAEHQGNISQAAKAAGKDRRTLQRLLRKYALDRESFKSN